MGFSPAARPIADSHTDQVTQNPEVMTSTNQAHLVKDEVILMLRQGSLQHVPHQRQEHLHRILHQPWLHLYQLTHQRQEVGACTLLLLILATQTDT